MKNVTCKTGGPAAVVLKRLVSLLVEKPGMTAAEIGNAMWAKRAQGDLCPARFARPAGKILHRAKTAGMVYPCLNLDTKKIIWYAHKQANESS
jgi:hypothetical protein